MTQTEKAIPRAVRVVLSHHAESCLPAVRCVVLYFVALNDTLHSRTTALCRLRPQSGLGSPGREPQEGGLLWKPPGPSLEPLPLPSQGSRWRAPEKGGGRADQGPEEDPHCPPDCRSQCQGSMTRPPAPAFQAEKLSHKAQWGHGRKKQHQKKNKAGGGGCAPPPGKGGGTSAGRAQAKASLRRPGAETRRHFVGAHLDLTHQKGRVQRNSETHFLVSLQIREQEARGSLRGTD